MASASMDVVIKAEHRSPTDPRSPGQTLRTRGGCSYSSRRTPFLMQENPGLGVGAPPSVRKGVEPEHLRTRGGCSYGSRRTPFLMQENPGLGVGAPPSVRKGVEPEHLRTRGGCSYGSRRTPVLMWENPGLGVGAPPSVRKGCQARAPSHPGRVLLPFERDPRFGCRRIPVWV